MCEKSDTRISIIIPVYNTENYLERCIDSVVNQTYSNLDIILVNDGSTDRSGQICDSYSNTDERIKVIHKVNGGQASARSAGIALAQGEYITFIDSDDYIDTDAYETIIKSMTLNEYPDMIAYDLIEEYEDHISRKVNNFKDGLYDRNRIENKIFPEMLSYGEFFDFGILPNLVCKIIRREYLKSIEVNVSENVRFGEDAVMVFQMMPNLNLLQIIKYAPYHYNKRNDSMIWQPMGLDEIESLRNDLQKFFIQSEFRDSFMSQLEDYITFVSLLKCPSIILDSHIKLDSKRIALYGAGGFGQAMYGEYSKNISIWVDKSFEKYQRLNIPVSGVEALIDRSDEYDIIFIAILNTKLCSVIKEELAGLGIWKKIEYFKM